MMERGSGRDRVLLRTKDVSIIILICTLLGLIGTQTKKIYRWDETADKIVQLETRIRAAETTNTVVVTQLDSISKQLEQINWQLRRINNNGRNH